MKIKSLIGIILVIMIGLAIVFYLQSGGKKVDVSIPENVVNAKELVKLAKPYVDEYFKTSDYYVGKVSMALDKNQRGQVEIWYKDKKKDKNGVPNIITVKVDTTTKKIIRIVKQERNSKIEPGIINIDNWSIDSSKAIDIALECIKKDINFDFTSAYLSGSDIYLDGKEIWDVTLFNENSKKSVYVKIDVYTGDVYKYEKK